MSNMQIYNNNLLDTTTSISMTNGSSWTDTAEYLFDRKNNTNFSATLVTESASLLISSLSDEDVDLIAVQGLTTTNIGRITFYMDDGSTKTTLSIVNCNTSSADWNSSIPNGDMFLSLASTTVMYQNFGIDFYKDDTTTSASFAMSDLYITDLLHQFSYNPKQQNYKPKLSRQEYKHTLSDGGTAVYFVQDNFETKIKLEYVSSSDRASLLSAYQIDDSILFVPMPTGTNWDGEIYEVNWVDDFDLGYTANYKGNGFDVKINLEETPK